MLLLNPVFGSLLDILREFNSHLVGVSHGMGTREQLPETQLSVAESGATTDKMPEQVSRLFMNLRAIFTL